jgi:flagellar biosynthesis protein FliR
MFGSSPIYLDQFLTFTLVFMRIATLVMVAPLFGPSAVPPRVRALVALALALLIVPLQLGKMTQYPGTLVDYLVLAGAECLIGLTLGLGIVVLFSGMQVAGQLISQMSGMQWAEMFDAGSGESAPIFSQLLFYVSVAVFVVISGHRKVLEALLDTFDWLPAGQGTFSRSASEAMTSLLAQSFELGVRAAAPIMVALLLATLVLGLIGRTLPQLNVMSLGFGFNALTVLGALSISLGTAAWIFQDELEPALATLVAALRLG